jgi:putative oxidoreductase
MVGITFMLHGWAKLQNPNGFIGFVGSLGFPAPAFFGWLVILLEFAGGLLLILGLATRFVALALAIEMVVTSLLVKSQVGFIAGQGQGAGSELDLLLMAASLALAILGAGALSIDESVLNRREVTERGLA